MDYRVRDNVFTLNTDYNNLKFICNKETGRWVIAKDINTSILEEISLPFNKTKFYGVSLIVLNVGRKCNFNCTYCHVGSTKNQDKILDWRVWEKVLDNLYELRNSNIQIVFHGSEPMLYYKNIKQYIDNFKKMNISVEFCLQSNGSLFTRNNIEWLVQNNIGIGISCDGLNTYQDITRPFKDASPTSNIVKKNIKIVKDIQGGISIITVVTKNNVNYLSDILEKFNSIGVNSVLFNPVYINSGSGLKPSLKDLISNFCKIFDEYLNECIKKESTIDVLNFKKILRIFFKPKTTTNCLLCGAGPNHPLMAIDTDGSIYSCDYFWENEKYKIGNINNTTILNSLNSPLDIRVRRDINAIDGCNNCNWKLFCGGGCPGGVIHAGRGINGKELYCEYYRAVFSYMARKIPVIHSEGLIAKFIEKD